MSNDIDDDFVDIEKIYAGTPLPGDIIRIGTGISIGHNIGRKMFGRLPEVGDRIAFKVQYNSKKKMLRFTKSNPREGFIFRIDKNQRSLSLNTLPVGMKIHKIPRGEYIEVSGQENVFVWNKEFKAVRASQISPPKDFCEEDTNVEEGDVICWVNRVRAVGERERIATGKALRIFVNQEGDEMVEVKPMSSYLAQSAYFVKKANVIIRRKK